MRLPDIRAALVVVALAATGCNRAQVARPAPPQQATRVAERRRVGPGPELFTGLVVALREEEVIARVQGRLVELRGGIGDSVSAGEILARLEAPLLYHELRRARAARTSARAAHRAAGVRSMRASEDSERATRLGDAVSAQARIHAVRSSQELAAEASVARAEVRERTVAASALEEQVGSLTLSASIDGNIASIYRRPGEMLEPGDPLARIVSSEAFVRFAVPAPQDVRIGQRVELRSASATIESHIVRVAPTVDTAGMRLAETAPIPAQPDFAMGQVCDVALAD